MYTADYSLNKILYEQESERAEWVKGRKHNIKIREDLKGGL